MVSLYKYYLYFFLFCVLSICVCGVLAALLPVGVGGVLTALPYLISMILVLYLFLKQQKRAPTQLERKKFMIVLSLIFWVINISSLVLGILYFSRNSPDIWQNFQLYLSNPMFLAIVLVMFLLIAIPLAILTYWFYGKQAQRMANQMFNL